MTNDAGRGIRVGSGSGVPSGTTSSPESGGGSGGGSSCAAIRVIEASVSDSRSIINRGYRRFKRVILSKSNLTLNPSRFSERGSGGEVSTRSMIAQGCRDCNRRLAYEDASNCAAILCYSVFTSQLAKIDYV